MQEGLHNVLMFSCCVCNCQTKNFTTLWGECSEYPLLIENYNPLGRAALTRTAISNHPGNLTTPQCQTDPAPSHSTLTGDTSHLPPAPHFISVLLWELPKTEGLFHRNDCVLQRPMSSKISDGSAPPLWSPHTSAGWRPVTAAVQSPSSEVLCTGLALLLPTGGVVRGVRSKLPSSWELHLLIL